MRTHPMPWRGATALLSITVALASPGFATAAETRQPPAPDAAAAPAIRTASSAEPTARAPRLPLAAFAALPAWQGMTLSPDGRRVAGLYNDADRSALVTRDLDGQHLRTVLDTDNQRIVLRWARWVNDERLLASIAYPEQRRDLIHVETRLISVKADGSGMINLGRDRMASPHDRAPQFEDRVIDWMPDDGGHVLVEMPDRGRLLPAVYRIDVANGLRTEVQAPEAGVQHWIADAQHRVRIGIARKDGKGAVRVCDPDGSHWRPLGSGAAGDAIEPLGFGRDPQELYVRADHDGRAAIWSVRLDAPGLPRTLRYALDRRDVRGGLVRSPVTGEVIGVRIARSASGDTGTEDDAPSTADDLWDDAWRARLARVRAGLPGRGAAVASVSRDEKEVLVFANGDGRPGLWVLAEDEGRNLSTLGENYPELPVRLLARKQPVTIPARDGLALPALLTLPVGAEAGGAPLPLVLLPHGGPARADSRRFDPWSAFFANRGYAVLQVEYRGSAGFGRDFMAAGLRRWGLEMQDDLADAARWAIARRLVDPALICIVGADYGGYAALMGVAKTPELYRCAVSVGAVTDLRDQYAFETRFLDGRTRAERTFGDYWDDAERMRDTSPRRLVDRIRAPVLLVHGTDDAAVPFAEAEAMAGALKGAGKAVDFIAQPDGDHAVTRNANRVQLFEAMERFLDRNLGAGGDRTAAVR